MLIGDHLLQEHTPKKKKGHLHILFVQKMQLYSESWNREAEIMDAQ